MFGCQVDIGELYWLQVDLPLRLSGQRMQKRVEKEDIFESEKEV